MITVAIRVDELRILRKITANGHSLFTEKGKDIVCAAVSSLLYTVHFTLTQFPEMNIFFSDVSDEWQLELLDFNTGLSGELKGITLFLINGLKILADNYPEHVYYKVEFFK